MHLYLVQHGEATSDAEDPARPLTAAGARAVERMAEWVRSSGAIDARAVHHSGKTRAAQTATLLAGALGPDASIAAAAGLAPRDDVTPLAASLAERGESLMVVGPLPHLARLAGLLVTGDAGRTPVNFVNAGIVCLERDARAWRVVWSLGPAQVLPAPEPRR